VVVKSVKFSDVFTGFCKIFIFNQIDDFYGIIIKMCRKALQVPADGKNDALPFRCVILP